MILYDVLASRQERPRVHTTRHAPFDPRYTHIFSEIEIIFKIVSPHTKYMVGAT